MREDIWTIIFVIFMIIVIGLGIWYAIFQWYECRDMGFSFWYCVKHIS